MCGQVTACRRSDLAMYAGPEPAGRGVQPRDCFPCWKRLRRARSSGTRTSISEDLYFEILRFLPVKSLLRFRCVCESWLQMIDSFAFFNAHMQTQRSKKSFRIFMHHPEKKSCAWFQEPEKYFMYPPLPLDNSAPIFCYLYLVEFEKGKATIELLTAISSHCVILHSSDGLILLKMHVRSDILVMNPMKRKLLSIPLGSRPSPIARVRKHPGYESYALTFVASTRDYKLVHLFRDELGYIQCEILYLRSRSWETVVNWPTIRLEDELCDGSARPVQACAALHWIKLISKDSFVSIGIEDDKFYETKLPKLGADLRTFKLIELDESLLCVVGEVRDYTVELYILKSMDESEWMKHSTFRYGREEALNPLWYARNSGEMLFLNCGPEYTVQSYDLQLRVRRKVEISEDPAMWMCNRHSPERSYDRLHKHESYTSSLATWNN